ncbi:Rho-related GTP-binding protein RhoN [Liparis tanakae]|uniref:Rho-related GTP-binding protein RhoN n=1 Tax=Liparis tanakae TaxID=230148 RepID=A0A4Z2J6W9_9TELE|nr:Rho-related GTP-binding protein RhoN [Liparis tanakae]
MPFKGSASSTAKAQGALINIPWVETADEGSSPLGTARCTVIHTKDRLQQLQHLMCDHDQSELAVIQRSSYYDNVRPLAYPDSDAVLVCFDISRPETLDSVIKKRAQIPMELRSPVSEEPKAVTVSRSLQAALHSRLAQSLTYRCRLVSQQWQGETQEFCPNAKVVLVGCKLDMRTDVGTLRELSKQRLIPVTHEQVKSHRKGEGEWGGYSCNTINRSRIRAV